MAACHAGLVEEGQGHAVSSQSIVRHDQPTNGATHYAPIVAHATPVLTHATPIVHHAAPLIHSGPIIQHVAPIAHAAPVLAHAEQIEDHVSIYYATPNK